MEREAKRWSNVVFAALFALGFILFSRILAPFWVPVLVSAFLVVLFMPLRERLSRTLGRGAASAAVSTGIVFSLIIVPAVVVGWLVGRELLGVLDSARQMLEDADVYRSVLANGPPWMRSWLPADPHAIGGERVLFAAVSSGADLTRALLSAGTSGALSLFLMAVSMYYFFLDGRRIVAELARLLPLDRRYFLTFVKEFKDVAYGMIYGNTAAAVVQGGLALIGFVIAGVPHAAIWSVAVTAVALFPVGGTVLVWGPIGVAMILGHRVGAGSFVLLWGLIMVSLLDSVVRPRICGSRMTLHPLLVFLSMFGGLAVFGLPGLLLGPLIASLFMAMVRIYQRDFLGKVPRVTWEPTPSADIAAAHGAPGTPLH